MTSIRISAMELRRFSIMSNEESQTVFCNYCGHGNPYDAMYCSKCGKQLQTKIDDSDITPTLKSEKAPETIGDDPSVAFGKEYITEMLKPYEEECAQKDKNRTVGMYWFLSLIPLFILIIVFSQNNDVMILFFIMFFIAMFVGIIYLTSSIKNPQPLPPAGKTKHGKMCCPQCGSKQFNPITATSEEIKLTKRWSTYNSQFFWVCHECGTKFTGDSSIK